MKKTIETKNLNSFKETENSITNKEKQKISGGASATEYIILLKK